MVANRQIGQDPQSLLLWEISKQLERLIKLVGQVANNTVTTTTSITP